MFWKKKKSAQSYQTINTNAHLDGEDIDDIVESAMKAAGLSGNSGGTHTSTTTKVISSGSYTKIVNGQPVQMTEADKREMQESMSRISDTMQQAFGGAGVKISNSIIGDAEFSVSDSPSVMKCPNCGAEVVVYDDKISTCEYCGSKVTE